MKVTLVPDITYTVKTADGEIGPCRVVSRWEGFMKLEYMEPVQSAIFASAPVHREKRHIIVEEPEAPTSFSALFASIFDDKPKESEVGVLKIAPSIAMILVPKAKT